MKSDQTKKMNITITKSSIIPPSETIPGSPTQLWTSNLDLVVGRIHILTVYFYRPNGSSNFFDASAMKKALADVLVSFYPMAGRLGRDESGRIVINCNGEGALFVEAESDYCLDDFGEFTPSPEFRSLTPTVDYSGDISEYPLFFAQVTHFKCGGVSLGCGVFHTLSDGLSSLHFINTWSDMARGLSVAIPPFIDRTLLRARDPPTPTHDHVEYHPPPTMDRKSGSLSKSSTAMLKLTLEQLNTLKAKAKSEGGPSYSTYEILAAHIWRCACKARGLPDDQLTKLYVATDGRSRLSPHLPRGYLGNVVFTATPVAKSGALTSDSLLNGAKLIHSTLTKMDNDYLRSAIDYLETQPDLSALIRGPSYFASPNLNINAWSRLPVYDADFGWGRPIFMGPAIILYEGTVYVLPSPNNDRSVSLAVLASFVGAMAIADLVKTTLGPKGMDKILQSTGRGHSVTVTNDGATILKSLHIDNPAAKVLIDISKVQDDEVGDGTTSVVVLAGELLREAEKLVGSKIHPMTIISGYRMAADCARSALLDRVKDNKDDAEKFRLDLMRIAMTTLSSKILSQDKEHFAKLAVDAVMRLKGSTNLESIQIIKKAGGSLKDSFLDEGFILDKKIGLGQPKRIENANILVANTAMDTDKVKIYGARVRVDSMAKVAQIEGAEKEKMREKVQKIIGHGINCFVNRQLIYNFPEELFADAGILAIEHADFDGIERLALVTGGEIASTFDNPESVKLGHCKLIEEIMIGEDKLIHFSGVEMGQACTIVLRGASFHVLDEAERSLHDALCVLSQTINDSRVLLGGGWPEMVMAKAVDELARKTPGKKSHAMEAFSRALIAIPTTIADNAGLDSAELVAQLRAEHHKEDSNAGIDVITGAVGDMSELGISEAFKVKQAVLLSATEAAEMILRVDEIITCAPRRREDRM